jgi:hypothetical protein
VEEVQELQQEHQELPIQVVGVELEKQLLVMGRVVHQELAVKESL